MVASLARSYLARLNVYLYHNDMVKKGKHQYKVIPCYVDSTITKDGFFCILRTKVILYNKYCSKKDRRFINALNLGILKHNRYQLWQFSLKIYESI